MGMGQLCGVYAWEVPLQGHVGGTHALGKHLLSQPARAMTAFKDLAFAQAVEIAKERECV